jgi:signal transduction histidine kinase
MRRTLLRLSIPTRTFLGFGLVIVAFGAVAAASIVQHQRTAQTLRLLPGGLLALAIDVAELRANHGVFLTRLDGILEEQDSTASRAYLRSARVLRASLVRRAQNGVRDVMAFAVRPEQRAMLKRVAAELDAVRLAYADEEARLDQLTQALVARDRLRAERLLGESRTRERGVERRLRRASDLLQDGIQEMSAEAEREERRSLQILGLLTAAALLVGLLVTLYTRAMLAPLRRVQARLAAIGRGELATGRLATTDDDELGRLAAEIERMVDALLARDARVRELQAQQVRSERLAAIGRMAAHVTHEVRNPLSSIGLNLELLEEELADAGSEPKALLRAIRREVDRLTAYTEEYLRLARLPAPRLERGDLGEAVHEAAELVRAEMDAAGIAFTVDIAQALPRVALDEAQIRQCMLNLLRNAREALTLGRGATEKGGSGGGGAVSVKVEAAGDRVVVTVVDDGPGIPPEVRARIFEPFYTTKERGTGLGLPLTQQIVLAHGGDIEVRGGPGVGTEFVLSFPALDRGPAGETSDDGVRGADRKAEPASGAEDGPRRGTVDGSEGRQRVPEGTG